MKKKILIYGAGQLGINAMAYILNNRYKGEADVVMYSPHNHKRVEGAIEDLKDACAIDNHFSGWKFKATNDVEDFTGCDLAFFCAGASFTADEYEKAKQNGIDDRMLQASKNIDILKEFCSSVKAYCPKATVFVVTNPVDMMTEIAGKELSDDKVYGLGCYLDSARFRREFFEELQNNGFNTDFDSMKGWILGHHCATMFLDTSSLSFVGMENIEQEKLQKMIANALDKTRKRGLTITNINAAAQTKKLNNGAYFAPSVMIADVMVAFVNDETLILPVNRKIYNEDNLGVVGYRVQMMAKIENNTVMPVFTDLSLDDVGALKYSIDTYEESKKIFKDYK